MSQLGDPPQSSTKSAFWSDVSLRLRWAFSSDARLLLRIKRHNKHLQRILSDDNHAEIMKLALLETALFVKVQGMVEGIRPSTLDAIYNPRIKESADYKENLKAQIEQTPGYAKQLGGSSVIDKIAAALNKLTGLGV